jgi:hypothetical protein
MPKFLVVHPPLPAPATLEEVTPLGKKVKANSTLDAYWVRSWLQCNKEGKIVRLLGCEWNAVDAESIRKVLAKVPELRVEGIYPMMIVDSEDFR